MIYKTSLIIIISIIHFKNFIKQIFINIINNLNSFTFVSLVLNFFNHSKKIYKQQKFEKFLNQNSKFWSHKYNYKKKQNTFILESFINHEAYSISNSIIGKYLQEIYNSNLIGIIKPNNFRGIDILKSYGIKDIIFFKEQTLKERIQNLHFINNQINLNDSIKNFLNFKYLKTDAGMTAYDSYIRYKGDPNLNNVNYSLLFFLTDVIYACNFFNNILDKNKFSGLIQSETSFSPSNSLFQISLSKKIKVYSRVGTSNLTIRIYDNFKQRYKYRNSLSNKLFEHIFKLNKKKCIDYQNDIQDKKFKDGSFGIDPRVLSKNRNVEKKMITKNEFISKFNWDRGKKIIVIFLHHLIDRNYHSGPRKNFIDNYSWTKYILNVAKNSKNFNWIIKRHPSEEFYSSKKNFNSEIKFLEKEFNHIKIFPDYLSQISLINITDIAISSNGSVGIEYPSFKIPSFFMEESPYSELNFLKKNMKNKSFFNNLDKVKISNLSIKDVEKSKVYLSLMNGLLFSKCNLIPQHNLSRDFSSDKFWVKCIEKIKKFKFRNDELFIMFKNQLKFNIRHTVNLNNLKLRKIKINDLN